jgi:hypothetical protein
MKLVNNYTLICGGPSHTKSIGRKSYMMPIIDGYSGYMRGYFLTDKQAETTLNAIKQEIALIEQQTGSKV